MPQYRVKVTGMLRVTAFTHVTVEASTEEEAKELGLEEADTTGYSWEIDHNTWDASDIPSDSIHVDNVEEVEDGD